MTRSITFGQSPDCDVKVSDPYASGKHCRITERDGRFFVEDLGSTNGTWIIRKSGVKVQVWAPTSLNPGDQVRIGRTTLPWSAS